MEQETTVTTRKVQNPNAKGNSAFIWAVAAVLAIAALVIGIIVYNGQNKRHDEVQATMIDASGIEVQWTEGDPVISLSGEGDTDAKTADLFEDFSCSHCADLHEATDAEMIEALKKGDIKVDLRPMVAQDQGVVGHATKSLAAVLALFNAGDNDAAFTLRDYLFANQQSVFNNLDADGFADLAKQYGASDQAVQDIRDEKFVETAEKIGEENGKYQEEETGKAWTPRVLIDGKDAEDLGADRNEWVKTLSDM